MGQELRSIVLDDEEFKLAAGLYFEQQPGSAISAANIDRVAQTDGVDQSATVHLRDPLVDGKSVVSADKQQMIEMVVAFCRHRAVPLPKSGRKSIVRRDGHTILEIELDWF